MNTTLYSEQLDSRVYATLAARHHPALTTQKHVVLLQHDNGPPGHTAAALIKAKIKELSPGIEFLPHSAYSFDLAAPSDYHLFCTIAEILRRGRQDLRFFASHQNRVSSRVSCFLTG